MKRNLYN